ncbi:hypothetical protein AF335_20810 [Streptomyces eurocidicus]|uniref:Putative RmlC-like cupin family protein n=1 Tax=Streptomyces eurocidicus TaxID=66423 RepID=A0A2N8NTT3_STREU|nr:hypothetical protein [Streptomyces eurocidicus]MBB5119379.1 putative RmlC-like cupin family protein [Streptomyces eurocidicus]MBF6053042.1 hypothetical protein [Streptomyces eurocidicus]PNE32167.1 hypothetical protein AF335_20810 [Streptomyces eurocidicus]
MADTAWPVVTGLLIVACTVVLVAHIALKGSAARDRAHVLKALSEVVHALAGVVRAFWGRK